MNAALRPLVASIVVLLAGAASGGTLLWMAKRTLALEARALNAAKSERRATEERIAGLAQEAREMHGQVALWNRLTELRILGEERRLEWLDALARIRAARRLPDLRYQIEPQKPWKSERPGAALQVRSSTMKVELALLHEGDLLRFLDDLRGSSSAYYAVRRCSIQRSPAQHAMNLRAKCEIELFTMAEAKKT